MYCKKEKYINSCGWKPKGKRPLGRTGHRYRHNIKINLKEVRWEGELMSCWIRTNGKLFLTGHD
jgi:hypothetical protein